MAEIEDFVQIWSCSIPFLSEFCVEQVFEGFAKDDTTFLLLQASIKLILMCSALIFITIQCIKSDLQSPSSLFTMSNGKREVTKTCFKNLVNINVKMKYVLPNALLIGQQLFLLSYQPLGRTDLQANANGQEVIGTGDDQTDLVLF